MNQEPVFQQNFDENKLNAEPFTTTVIIRGISLGDWERKLFVRCLCWERGVTDRREEEQRVKGV